MNTNNDVWQEVAKGRSDDALRWQRQEQQIKEAQGTHLQRPGLIQAVEATVVGLLAAARKVTAQPRSTEPGEPVREQPKSYAEGHS